MKILTFNIRNALADDGANGWKYRKDFVYDYLLKSNADIICLQEVVPAVKVELVKVLFDLYECVGEGRLVEPKEYDEVNLIAYKKSLFKLTAKEHFWLSDTPNIAGSKYPTQEHWPRTCTHVMLKRNDDVFYDVFATHLDNVDAAAREKGLKLIMSRADTCENAIICGDFNDTPNNVHNWISDRFIDITCNIGSTYTEYGNAGLKIDYILVSKNLTRLSESVCDVQVKNGLYISDHFPVSVDII